MENPNPTSPDMNQMPAHPSLTAGRRGAHSEILSFPDDINFDDAAVDLLSMYLEMERRDPLLMEPMQAESSSSGSSEGVRVRHQQSQSMDGATSSIKMEIVGTKKTEWDAKLAEHALVYPGRANRIWASRQATARWRERKMRYISELERKVPALQAETKTLSVQLAMLQRDADNLTAENNELRLRLQSMEQHAQLQDALKDALREEVEHLKKGMGQVNFPNGGPRMNFGPSSFEGHQPFYDHNPFSLQSVMADQQLQHQQLQIYPQHQQPSHQLISN